MNTTLDEQTNRRVAVGMAGVVAAAPLNAAPRFGDVRRRFTLTARQTEVLRLAAEGYTDREIAHALFIETRTATTHMTDIFDKLGVNRRTAAVASAIRQGII
jgi:DNA-binding CsgD family transcriptional regulator